MPNRESQRLARKEKRLSLYDHCGIKDPTPYEAVKNIIRKEQKDKSSKNGTQTQA